jgi:ligand-binding sensor domain-containing protein
VVSVEGIFPSSQPGLYAAPDGALWLTSSEGIARLEGDSWQVTVQPDEMAGKLVGIDQGGRAWALKDQSGVLSAWDGTSWTAHGAETGGEPVAGGSGSGLAVFPIDQTGGVWLAASMDVRRFDGARWTVIPPQQMGMQPTDLDSALPAFLVTGVDSGRQIWVGQCEWIGPGPGGGQGARWFDGETWQGADSPVASGCVTQIEEDGLGRVWVALDDTLWRYDLASGAWAQFVPPTPPDDFPRFGWVYDLTVDRAGDAWPVLALCGGASCFTGNVPYRLHDGEWTQLADRDEGYGLSTVVLDGNDTPWLFWGCGIYRVVDGMPEHVADQCAYSATAGPEGAIYFVGPMGDEDYLWALSE